MSQFLLNVIMSGGMIMIVIKLVHCWCTQLCRKQTDSVNLHIFLLITVPIFLSHQGLVNITSSTIYLYLLS